MQDPRSFRIRNFIVENVELYTRKESVQLMGNYFTSVKCLTIRQSSVNQNLRKMCIIWMRMLQKVIQKISILDLLMIRKRK